MPADSGPPEFPDAGHPLPSPGHCWQSLFDDHVARFEAALWQKSQEHFACETDTDRRLSELQGKMIANMYAHVRLIPEHDESVADQSRIEPYLNIKGILLERIPGYDLWDLPISSPVLLQR